MKGGRLYLSQSWLPDRSDGGRSRRPPSSIIVWVKGPFFIGSIPGVVLEVVRMRMGLSRGSEVRGQFEESLGHLSTAPGVWRPGLEPIAPEGIMTPALSAVIAVCAPQTLEVRR